MKKVIYIFFYIFSSTILSSCYFALYNDIDENCELCKFDTVSTGLDKMININGFYADNSSLDTTYYGPSVLFFKDGTFGTFFINPNKYYNSDTIISLINNINHYYKNSVILNGGCYFIKNDTIITHEYSISQLTWELFERKYVIISSSLLKLCEWHWCSKDSVLREIHSNKNNKDIIYSFVPANDLPSSDDVWIKRKKRLWQSQEQWKAYRQRIKKKRKEMK